MARRIAVAFAVVGVVSLLWAAQGCSGNGDTSGPADCVAAGGQCVVGSVKCAESGPQDCDPNHTPAGFFCCLAAAESDAAEDASAPCPTALPQTGSACTPEGTECGYSTSTNACGADNCYCQSGAWNCEPTCIVVDASASVDADADGPAECIAAGGECLVGGAISVCALMGPQDCNPERGPSGSYCCLKKAGVADAAADGGAADGSGD